MSNQLQGYPGLTFNLDHRTADPKPYVTYFPGIIDLSTAQQHVHFLADKSGKSQATSKAVPNNKIVTLEKDLPREQESNSKGHHDFNSFGETIVLPLGDEVYARSGDKGANVNVGFFFPSGPNAEMKWEWLRSFLTREKLCGTWVSSIIVCSCLTISLRTTWRGL
jgi:hypothetical protein